MAGVVLICKLRDICYFSKVKIITAYLLHPLEQTTSTLVCPPQRFTKIIAVVQGSVCPLSPRILYSTNIRMTCFENHRAALLFYYYYVLPHV